MGGSQDRKTLFFYLFLSGIGRARFTAGIISRATRDNAKTIRGPFIDNYIQTDAPPIKTAAIPGWAPVQYSRNGRGHRRQPMIISPSGRSRSASASRCFQDRDRRVGFPGCAKFGGSFAAAGARAVSGIQQGVTDRDRRELSIIFKPARGRLIGRPAQGQVSPRPKPPASRAGGQFGRQSPTG